MLKAFCTATILLSASIIYAQFPIEVINQWESTFQQYAMESEIIGLSVAVRSGDDLWVDQFGVSAIDEPLNEDHLFAMGSVSKTITSATILQMYEENLLSLEDPLHLYLDSYNNIDSTVTIRQLLNHTSGIYNYTDHPGLTTVVFLNPTQIVTPEEVLTQFVLAPSFSAGTDFQYSNTNYVLLGMIIEEIAGQTYYEEARLRFDFDNNYPSLVIPPFEISTDDLAHLWLALDGENVVDTQAEEFSLNAIFSGAGAAGAYAASPKDLTQWIEDLYTGQLLQPATMDELYMGSAFNENYGLGVIHINGFCETSLSGHSGNIVYTTASYHDAVNDISISVHTNDGNTPSDMGLLAILLFCDYNDVVSSITEFNNGVGEMTIFPNPFEEAFNLRLELLRAKIISYQVTDELGRIVYQSNVMKKEAGIHQLEINQDFSSGIYLLHVNVGNESFIRKLLKD